MNDPAYSDFFEVDLPPAKEKQIRLSSLIDKCRDARGVITNSVEFMRILALPRRALDFENVEDVTPIFRREGGTMNFWPIQSAALIEASIADGLFAPIAVGFGKTLVTLSLPEAMNSKNAVLLVPPALKKKTITEIKNLYSKHFHLPLDRLTIVAYSELSSAKKATILEDIAPDLIIADEAHALRHKTSARTKRFLRYAKEHPECRYAFLSGTMTNRSILDYAHLLELALRKNSPLPYRWHELKDWSGALDVKPSYTMMPGVLTKLCEGKETVREGFRRRLVETQGVVATSEDSLGTGLIVRRRVPALPEIIEETIQVVRKTWQIEDEEIDSPLEFWRILRQLSCGFYYRWVWPDGKKDFEWLEARAAWNKAVRERLKLNRAGQDSPLLCFNAAQRYWEWAREGKSGPCPENSWDAPEWPAWSEQKHKSVPPTIPIWLDDFLIDDALKTARAQSKHGPAIIWYEHRVLGERIAEEGSLPHFGAGTDASDCREPIIVCSMRTQGTGKNLQYYSYNLLTSLPPNGSVFEQVVGRTHRPGQTADDVLVDWYGHTEATMEALSAVIEDAEYMEETTGQRQKVLYATRVFN